MLKALALVGALSSFCLAQGEPSEKPAFKMLGFLKSVAEDSGLPAGKSIAKTSVKALKEIEATPPEQRPKAAEKIVEHYIPEMNAAADAVDASMSPEGARKINDAMAQINNAAGRPQDALRYSQNALNIDPADRDALISHSAANLALNRPDAALADASRAAKLAPDDPGALRARAMASYQLRDYNQAREDAARVLALLPNDQTSFAILQLASAKVPSIKLEGIQARLAGQVQSEYQGMVQQMNQVAERRARPETQPVPKPTEDLMRSAASKISIKDYFGAISDADRALAADPDNARAYFFRAAAENLVGRYGDAASDATKALMIDPHDARARDTRAWAYNNLGRYRDAIADSTHSLEIEPRNPYAYWNLSYAHEHMGDLSAMLRDLKQAAALNPQFESAYQDAARRHGIEPEPLGQDRFRRQEPAADRNRARRRSFTVVVVSSLAGGLLIAAGFIHLYGESKAASPGAKKNPAPTLPALGDGYVLGKQIGTGGMGVVFEAFDKGLERHVAVKVLRPELGADAKAREHLLQEARTVASLHHPAIVDIHAVVEDKAGFCLIFERLEGRTVHDLLRERGRLSFSEARALLKPVCQGLDFAHRHGVVHRDLKPGNIMVTSSGQVKLMDFGISRAEASHNPLSPAERATANGTPYYMSPEQERGEVRRESDVYSLGACLYEMVTGRPPYEAPFAMSQKLDRAYPAPSTLVPGLPQGFDELISFALNPDPHERIRTASDFWALLDRLKSGQRATLPG